MISAGADTSQLSAGADTSQLSAARPRSFWATCRGGSAWLTAGIFPTSTKCWLGQSLTIAVLSGTHIRLKISTSLSGSRHLQPDLLLADGKTMEKASVRIWHGLLYLNIGSTRNFVLFTESSQEDLWFQTHSSFTPHLSPYLRHINSCPLK